MGLIIPNLPEASITIGKSLYPWSRLKFVSRNIIGIIIQLPEGIHFDIFYIKEVEHRYRSFGIM